MGFRSIQNAKLFESIHLRWFIICIRIGNRKKKTLFCNSNHYMYNRHEGSWEALKLISFLGPLRSSVLCCMADRLKPGTVVGRSSAKWFCGFMVAPMVLWVLVWFMNWAILAFASNCLNLVLGSIALMLLHPKG